MIDWRSKVPSNLSIRGEFNLSASIRTSLPKEIELVERRQWSHDLVRVDQTTIGTPYAITETQSNQSKQYTINTIKRVHTRSKSRKAIQIKKIHLQTLETRIDYSLVIDLSKDTNKEIKRSMIELDRRSGGEKRLIRRLSPLPSSFFFSPCSFALFLSFSELSI